MSLRNAALQDHAVTQNRPGDKGIGEGIVIGGVIGEGGFEGIILFFSLN